MGFLVRGGAPSQRKPNGAGFHPLTPAERPVGAPPASSAVADGAAAGDTASCAQPPAASVLPRPKAFVLPRPAASGFALQVTRPQFELQVQKPQAIKEEKREEAAVDDAEAGLGNEPAPEHGCSSHSAAPVPRCSSQTAAPQPRTPFKISMQAPSTSRTEVDSTPASRDEEPVYLEVRAPSLPVPPLALVAPLSLFSHSL